MEAIGKIRRWHRVDKLSVSEIARCGRNSGPRIACSVTCCRKVSPGRIRRCNVSSRHGATSAGIVQALYSSRRASRRARRTNRLELQDGRSRRTCDAGEGSASAPLLLARVPGRCLPSRSAGDGVRRPAFPSGRTEKKSRRCRLFLALHRCQETRRSTVICSTSTRRFGSRQRISAGRLRSVH